MPPDKTAPWAVASPGFPDRLAKRMKDADRRVRELAEASDVNKSTISLWRKGEQKRYTVETVERVAAELGTTAAELLDLPDPSPAKSGGPAAISAEQLELLHRVDSLRPLLDQILPELEQLLDMASRAAASG
jgi:transcriptional regulator with XRE-family HTH domain